MNIKKLVCFFALLALCCTYPFAIVNEINGQALHPQRNDNGGGGGGSSNYATHYVRHNFLFKFVTQENSSTGFGLDSAERNSGTSYENHLFSCCIYTWKWWKECDFSVDGAECDKYIDRESGKPYDFSVYTY